jgi:hypothetical protein
MENSVEPWRPNQGNDLPQRLDQIQYAFRFGNIPSTDGMDEVSLPTHQFATE